MIVFSVRSTLSAIYALSLSKKYKSENVCFLIVHESVKGLNLSTLNGFIREQGYDNVYDINILNYQSSYSLNLSLYDKFKRKFLYILSLKTALKNIPEDVLNRGVDVLFYCGGSSYRLPFNWSNGPRYNFYEHGIGNTLNLVNKSITSVKSQLLIVTLLKHTIKKAFGFIFFKISKINYINSDVYINHYSLYSFEFNKLLLRRKKNPYFDKINLERVRLFFNRYCSHVTNNNTLFPDIVEGGVDIFILPALVDYMKMVAGKLPEMNLSNIALIKPHPSFYNDKSYLIFKELIKKHYDKVILMEDINIPIESIVSKFPVKNINVIGRLSTSLFNISKMFQSVNVILFLPNTLKSNSRFSSFPNTTEGIITEAFSDTIKIFYEK